MAQTRLSGLSFKHINYDKDINIDKVIENFARNRERALEFFNVCSIDGN